MPRIKKKQEQKVDFVVDDGTIEGHGEGDKLLAGRTAEVEKLTELRGKFKRLYDEIRQRLTVLGNVERQVRAVHEILTKTLAEHGQLENKSETEKEGPDNERHDTGNRPEDTGDQTAGE